MASDAGERMAWKRVENGNGGRAERADAPSPCRRSLPAGVWLAALLERRQEEQDQRDQQHVDDERLDQHEAEEQRAADVAGGAGVARDRFGGGGDGRALRRARRGRRRTPARSRP